MVRKNRYDMTMCVCLSAPYNVHVMVMEQHCIHTKWAVLLTFIAKNVECKKRMVVSIYHVLQLDFYLIQNSLEIFHLNYKKNTFEQLLSYQNSSKTVS